MTPTTSSAADFISVKLIKDAGTAINTHLLHLVNRVIQSETYPENLKTTKKVPIRKTGKPETDSTGW